MKSKIMFTLLVGVFGFLMVSGVCLAELVVVVNPQNPTDSISKKELSNIFKQRQKSWKSGGIIDVLNLPKDDPLREGFSEKILDKSPSEMEKYYLKRALSGKGQPPRTVQSSVDVKSSIGKNVKAIGYMDLKDVDTSVKVLPVDGKKQLD